MAAEQSCAYSTRPMNSWRASAGSRPARAAPTRRLGDQRRVVGCWRPVAQVEVVLEADPDMAVERRGGGLVRA